MRKCKTAWLFLFAALYSSSAICQDTNPVNGVADKRSGTYAFTNASIVKDAQNTVVNGTLVIREGKIIGAGSGVNIPADAVVIDCKGKYIYPSFIDIYSDYGVAIPQRPQGNFGFFAPAQIGSNTKGAYGWNQAIKAEVNAASLFTTDDSKAKPLRDLGFGTVLTHQKDGIARGTGAVVTLANKKENLVMIKERASANYSFSKGSSTQSYPQSMMGSIALLRQTFLDAQWYKNSAVNKSTSEGLNLSLQAWNNNLSLPQIFEANDKWNDLRADRIGDEFGYQFILKAGGNEYQRMAEMLATKASFILPLNFPQAMDVEDPNDARFVALEDMKNWEMAPTNPAAFEKAGINFCISTADLRDVKQFWANLRKAMEYGLTETKALEALTKTPATLLNIYNETGSLEAGKWANFIITNGPLFAEKTIILQNWVQGDKYAVKDDGFKSSNGVYNLTVSGPTGINSYNLTIKSANAATLTGKDSLAVKYRSDGKLVNISFSPVPSAKKTVVTRESITTSDSSRTVQPINANAQKRDSLSIANTPDDKSPDLKNKQGAQRTPGQQVTTVAFSEPVIRLSGTISDNSLQGTGVDTSGNPVTWWASFVKDDVAKPDNAKKKTTPVIGKLLFPNMSYGWESMPKEETILIRNATVWTNEKDGVLTNADVLVKNGKIAGVGKNLPAAGARIIDGTGKHLTPGVIDEHSHIAAASINEGGQSVSSEVRIGDNLAPDDINIYRQLSGGVTTSHILHGSANTIGGQTQLIKLRWGADDNDLKFKGADGFIKFALGENVKRTPSQNNNRFPDTRMGVEQVQIDAFTRAKDYEAALKGPNGKNVRRDLELDALVEIMNSKRFITCHSYVASEILETMKMAEKFGFKINTFTHILEGYKVADAMKAHGANASTFSDWWAYKMEVQDAIPYNAAIMHNVGLNVAINSDDPEMARRLNQEAAKSVKYSGMSEEDALKMVTLNPAVMLHIDKEVGSIKTGKDADLVLWSDNPLSIYAKAEKTLVDGIVYFDREKDKQMRLQIAAERNRLIQKMLEEKKSGGSMSPATPSFRMMNFCEEHTHQHGLLSEEAE
ncbi:MAG: secreted enzyme contains two amidohydrolase related domain [Ferruginibacter sp.]|nr:secreted enzyme contains two amidohydrolase related domain [Ferruginibacter sp.]